MSEIGKKPRKPRGPDTKPRKPRGPNKNPRGPDTKPRKQRTDNTHPFPSSKQWLREPRPSESTELAVPAQIEDDLGDLFDLHLDEPALSDSTITPRDRDLILRMASLQLNTKEIQSVLQLSQSQWNGSLIAQEAYQRGKEMGRATLRRLQWATAQRNPIMQIFLGKQYLGQADRHDVQQSEGMPVDARQGFANKLKDIINITPTGCIPGISDATGE